MSKNTAKKVAVKKSAPKSTSKAVKKTVTKKPAAKKVAAKKPVAKVAVKKAVKKPVAKAVVKKAVKKPAPKMVAKKPVAKVAAKPVSVAKKPTKKVAQKMPSKPVVAKIAVKTTAPMAKTLPANRNVKAAPIAQNPKTQYKVGNYVVYPTHGVGKIMAEETQMIGDIELRMLVISFEKDKMTLRVPMHRAAAAGLRPISGADQMKKVFVTLKSRAKISRGMWSRRAQEYETKINSGCVIAVAEVVRDLHQNVDQSERSYSERMIYESALARLVGELAAAEGTDHKAATDRLMKLLRAKVAAAAALKEAA
ncbi:MAG: CarD family transcriptional regulator [Alphaproteobacteria bacterium]|nr:CarD family transcriptional regulator [Alphaproteobacteria bacterium]